MHVKEKINIHIIKKKIMLSTTQNHYRKNK